MKSRSQRSQAVCPSVKRVNLLPQPGVPLCKWGSLLPFHLWRLWPLNIMQAVLSAFKAVGVQSSPRHREEFCHLHLEIQLVFACGAFYFINSGDGLINSSCHNRAAIRWPWLRHCASSLVPHSCCILSRCSRWAIWGLERAMGTSYLFMMQLRSRRDRIWTRVHLPLLALSQRVSDWVLTTVHSGCNQLWICSFLHRADQLLIGNLC